MYETEANICSEEVGQVPTEVINYFLEFREKVVARTLLPWGEHCTECVWPTCYTTCDLYSPREDGRCRRFVDGIVRLPCPGAVNSYLLKIRFKRWGKLWAPGNIRLFPLDQADVAEQRDQRIGRTLYQLPLPAPFRKFATEKRYSWKKRLALGSTPSSDAPDHFVIECFNPGDQVVRLSLTMRSSNGETTIPYQKLIQVEAGFHRERIPVAEISKLLDLKTPFGVELIPNDIADGTTLFFGMIDFIASKPAPRAKQTEKVTVKCVVWDLDNTLWNGILVEDGSDKLVLKDGIVEVIRTLDGRGILHSIASKNNFDEAMAVLKNRGLDEYFLHPQISWGPKSEALKAIAQKLNIGIDTLLLVDDSQFELAQVQSACPTAKILSAERYRELPEMPMCQVPVTEESSNRRKMYFQESVRGAVAEGFGGDYLAFLRACELEMLIEPLSPENLDRVHELTQRTNQMNFSGNRYEGNVLQGIIATPKLDTYVISCQDRYGSYGIVGFSIVDAREPRMTDLMFSCRIQAKRCEHTFLAHLIRKYRQRNSTDFWANYRKTPRNEPSGRVFADIGMVELETRDGLTSLLFRREDQIPDDGIIRVMEK
jgi:FkbH-like protein